MIAADPGQGSNHLAPRGLGGYSRGQTMDSTPLESASTQLAPDTMVPAMGGGGQKDGTSFFLHQ